MATTTQRRQWAGPAVLGFGFRPFFLFGSVYAALAMAVWVPWVLGYISLPSNLPLVAWHTHELLFGFVPAIIAGFLLTAIPNWTGRLPVVGWPLAGLFILWLCGRVAITLSVYIHPLATAAVSTIFLIALCAIAGREISAGGNRRNLKILFAVMLLATAQVLFHAELFLTGQPGVSVRLAIATVIMLIMIIGGRVIPSFTSSWIKQSNPGVVPAGFNTTDLVCLLASGVALVAWVLLPWLQSYGAIIGGFLIFAGFANVGRQVRWVPHRTMTEPLVAILHVAFAFVGLGFVLAGISALDGGETAETAAIHAWTTGAVGTMTLAIMTRASLGHTGHALKAPTTTIVIYLAVIVSALSRIIAAVETDNASVLLPLAGGAWIVAFAGFAICYGPMLLTPRNEA